MRRQASGTEFALAWNAALDVGRVRLSETALDRALNGVRQTVWYRGKAVGERVTHDDRLLIALLTRKRRGFPPAPRAPRW